MFKITQRVIDALAKMSHVRELYIPIDNKIIALTKLEHVEIVPRTVTTEEINAKLSAMIAGDFSDCNCTECNK